LFDFKHAGKEALKAEYTRIAKELNDHKFFTKKELNYVQEVISEGEQVLAFTSGFTDGDTWLIVLTDRRVLFLNKGFFYGLKQTSIDLNMINSISKETSLFFGSITIENGASKKSINKVWKSSVEIFVKKVNDATYALKNRADPLEQQKNQMEQLFKLGDMLQKGILTQEEFNVQKTKLLG
jgi:hypothetical protein